LIFWDFFRRNFDSEKKGLVQQGVKKRVDFFFLLMEPAIEKVCIQKFPEKTAVQEPPTKLPSPAQLRSA
jgi:hypothetical protein